MRGKQSSSSSSSLHSVELSADDSSSSWAHSDDVSSSEYTSSTGLAKRVSSSRQREITNLLFLFFLPLAFSCILNSIPLKDPSTKYTNMKEVFVEQWVWIFIYTPSCFLIAAVVFTRWIAYYVQVEITSTEYMVAQFILGVSSSIFYMVLAYVWAFPVPLGSGMAFMPSVMVFNAYIFYIVRAKLQERGDDNIIRLITSLLVCNVATTEILIAVISYNFMVHFDDASIQIAVTIVYSLISAAIVAGVSRVMQLVAGVKKGHRYDFAHFAITIWYKTFALAEISAWSVVAITVAIDAIMISKDVFAFSVGYDRAVDRMTEWCLGVTLEGEAHGSSSSTSTTHSHTDSDSSVVLSESESEGVSGRASFSRGGSVSDTSFVDDNGKTVMFAELSRAGKVDLFNEMDVDGNGELDAHEIQVLAHRIGADPAAILSYDADNSGTISLAEFLDYMLDEVVDVKVDRYISQQWASITAPIYYVVVLALMIYGVNAPYFLTSVPCTGYGDRCNDIRWAYYIRAVEFSVIVFAFRVIFNAIAVVFVRRKYGFNLVHHGLLTLAANLSEHVWEAFFATCIMVKFVVFHSNADVFTLTGDVAPWSPFSRG